MRIGKLIKRLAVAAVVGLLLAAGVLYVMVSSTPAGYAPLPLTPEQKKQAAKEFAARAAAFWSTPPTERHLSWSATEEELNRYLGSMDEIAWYRQSGKRGEVDSKLAAAGLSGLAVRLDDGVATLMARSEKYAKVVSADFSLTVTADKKLLVELAGVRVGKLGVPDKIFRERLNRLKGALAAKANGASSQTVGDAGPAGKVLEMFSRIVGAIDEAPIAIEDEVNSRRIRIEEVEIAEHRLTIRFMALPRDPSPSHR